jgi:hypothetical protein
MKLDSFDLYTCINRLPKELRELMRDREHRGLIFIGGGFIRACVAQEILNDIDIFTQDAVMARHFANVLGEQGQVIETENAITIRSTPVPMQLIHRWTFARPEDVALSFDFTVCCAVIFVNEHGEFDSYCDDRFYIDLANKRLVYRSPVRNEDAGGSMLRVLKYYQRGYRIPLDSLGAVIARMCQGVDWSRIDAFETSDRESEVAKVLTGLLREVNPNIDPTHSAHIETPQSF